MTSENIMQISSKLLPLVIDNLSVACNGSVK